MKKFYVYFILIFSLFFSLLVVNHFLPLFCQNCKPEFIVQLTEIANFNAKYVYWGKPECKSLFCKEPIDKYVTRKVLTINEDYGNCKNIVVLGDSFSDSPWDEINSPYSEYFARNLSAKNHACYKLLRVATNGSGNDQQLARFTDVVRFLNPDLVIWQFYWNDFYDNVEKPLYVFDNGKLKRTRSYHSAYFWSGWLNQKLPFLLGSNIGNFLLYFGELRKDFSSNWFKIENDPKILFNFNDKKMKAFLKEMTNLSKQYEFEYITTLSPLECEFMKEYDCKTLEDKSGIPYTFFSQIQRDIEVILKTNSNYVSMFDSNYSCLTDKLEDSDFWEGETERGARHLGTMGQQKVGETLFLNYSFLKGQGD